MSIVAAPMGSDTASLERAAIAAARAAARLIPPVWPLASSVAVNPFLGQTCETLAQANARLARVSGVPVTMPLSWYRSRIAAGAISDQDLAEALALLPDPNKPSDVQALKKLLDEPEPKVRALPTVADLAAQASGTDWTGLVADRVGAWASGYFDRGQALWVTSRGRSTWAAWRSFATRDLIPEIHGLTGFASFVADLPESVEVAVAKAVSDLALTQPMLDTYFHQLLLSLGGWAQIARYELWRAELAGDGDDTILCLLAVRLAWEQALLARFGDGAVSGWAETKAAHAEPLRPTLWQILGSVLQEAAERGGQRELERVLTTPVAACAVDARPALQAAFCIDVRSEVFRRALEAANPSIRTLGFAGFFGILAQHRRFGSEIDELRLPVLLNPTVFTCTGSDDEASKTADRAARYAARAKRAWGRFKVAAVSSLAYVEATGPIHAGQLLYDALGFRTPPQSDKAAPRFLPSLGAAEQVAAAETILRAMSLITDFARVVLLVGHGAGIVNNPLASALQCGACGGYPGDVNARLLAQLLNTQGVRDGLAERGIIVPEDTLFVGALHDTTTDAVTLYDQDMPSPQHAADLARIRPWLAAAGEHTRDERAPRLPRAIRGADIPPRARDWAEVRPEWGLSACKAFIAAPRARTAGRNLDGRVFLHDYDWRQDHGRGFGVLELIMTAPVVVASWISLQYYGSTVAPALYGAGNKLLHNVVGGIGVLEGNGGPLRVGLPWQSVHDGERLVHEPLRLSVCIEAPLEAMTDILSRHGGVRALFDQRWLHLFAIDGNGRLTDRYAGDLRWVRSRSESPTPSSEAVA